MLSKRHCIYFFSVLVAFIVVAGFIIYRHNSSNKQVVPDIGKFYQQIRSRLQIRGFQFNGYNEKGGKAVTIRADKYTVSKKKIGFITTSLFNEITIKNARIDMYSKGNVPEKKTAAELKEQFSDLSFENSFSQNALPALPAKNIASIMIQPITLNLYVYNSLVTSISASSASISMKQRDIVFKGNVKVISGERSLMTDRMDFSPEKAIIKTNSPFVLKTTKGQSEGSQFSSDIFLMPLSVQNDAKNAGKVN